MAFRVQRRARCNAVLERCGCWCRGDWRAARASACWMPYCRSCRRVSNGVSLVVARARAPAPSRSAASRSSTTPATNSPTSSCASIPTSPCFRHCCPRASVTCFPRCRHSACRYWPPISEPMVNASVRPSMASMPCRQSPPPSLRHSPLARTIRPHFRASCQRRPAARTLSKPGERWPCRRPAGRGDLPSPTP